MCHDIYIKQQEVITIGGGSSLRLGGWPNQNIAGDFTTVATHYK